MAAGSWRKLEVDDALADVEWLQRDGGQVGIELRASPSSTDGVHNVEVKPRSFANSKLYFHCKQGLNFKVATWA